MTGAAGAVTSQVVQLRLLQKEGGVARFAAAGGNRWNYVLFQRIPDPLESSGSERVKIDAFIGTSLTNFHGGSGELPWRVHWKAVCWISREETRVEPKQA